MFAEVKVDSYVLETDVPFPTDLNLLWDAGRKCVDLVEQFRQCGKKFVALRQQHSAVESEINSLEHHGLNRCLDVGIKGYQRYVGYGVMSYNRHIIGRELLARQRARGETLALAA